MARDRDNVPYKRGSEHIDETVVLEYRAGYRSFRLIKKHETEGDDALPTWMIAISKPVGAIDLTTWTSPEVIGLLEWMKAAVETVLPTTLELDRRAQRDLDAGATRNKRLWRSDPMWLDFDGLFGDRDFTVDEVPECQPEEGETK